MDVDTPLVADPQTPVLMQPADDTLDDPARLAESAPTRGVALRQHRLDVALPQLGLLGFRAVRPVALDACRTEARSPALAPKGRDRIDQREELGEVVSIRTSERDHQRDALRFGEDVVLAPRARPIGGIRARLEPPL